MLTSVGEFQPESLVSLHRFCRLSDASYQRRIVSVCKTCLYNPGHAVHASTRITRRGLQFHPLALNISLKHLWCLYWYKVGGVLQQFMRDGCVSACGEGAWMAVYHMLHGAGAA